MGHVMQSPSWMRSILLLVALLARTATTTTPKAYAAIVFEAQTVAAEPGQPVRVCVVMHGRDLVGSTQMNLSWDPACLTVNTTDRCDTTGHFAFQAGPNGPNPSASLTATALAFRSVLPDETELFCCNFTVSDFPPNSTCLIIISNATWGSAVHRGLMTASTRSGVVYINQSNIGNGPGRPVGGPATPVPQVVFTPAAPAPADDSASSSASAPAPAAPAAAPAAAPVATPAPAESKPTALPVAPVKGPLAELGAPPVDAPSLDAPAPGEVAVPVTGENPPGADAATPTAPPAATPTSGREPTQTPGSQSTGTASAIASAATTPTPQLTPPPTKRD